MPRTTGVDLHAFLDAVEAERARRSCPSVPVYRLGVEPLELRADWMSGDSARLGAGAARSTSLASSAAAARSRSRSPVRAALSQATPRPASRRAGGCSGPELMVRGSLEEWSGHFDGLVRPFRHGFVLGVDDALVDDGTVCRRSVFVDAFHDNRVLRGEAILAHCLARHRDGRPWAHVMDVVEALREIARAELRHGLVGALALLWE